MTAKWLIHLEDKVLGPWTASRVREALRTGEIDPFDKISMTGSPLTRELLEVDEIFINKEEEEQHVNTDGTQVYTPQNNIAEEAETNTFLVPSPPPQQKESDLPLFKLENIQANQAIKENIAPPAFAVEKIAQNSKEVKDEPTGNSNQFSKLIADAGQKQKEKLSQPNAKLALADPNLADTSFLQEQNNKMSFFGINVKQKVRVEPQGNKKYLAVTPKGYIVGPLTAEEVFEKYNKGIFSQNVLIKKGTSSSPMPIAKFIEGFALINSYQPTYNFINPAQNKAIVNNAFLTPSNKHSNRPTFLISLLVVSIIAFVGILISALQQPQTKQKAIKKKNENHVVRHINKNQIRDDKHEYLKNRPLKKIHPSKPSIKEKKAQYSPPKKSSIAKKEYKNARKKQSSQARVKTKAPSPIRKASFSKPSPTRRIDGQQVTLTSMSFSPAQLKSCSMKCELLMRNRQGEPIKVKFFKGQFVDTLSTRANNLTISGRIADSGSSLLLSDVK